MALVEVLRIADLTEAQVAASALRARGIPVLLQNELHGQNEPYLQQALGGFGIWTSDEDAEAARELLGHREPVWPVRPPKDWQAPLTLIGLLALVVSPMALWLLAPLRRRRDLPD